MKNINALPSGVRKYNYGVYPIYFLYFCGFSYFK